MKIVIDISAEDFEKVKCGRGAVSMMRKAIIHGTPLPEGAEILTKEAYSDLCTMAADAPNFESNEYIEQRLENYNKLLESGVLDCVKPSVEPERCSDCINREALLRKLQKVSTEAWKMKLKCNAETVWNQCIDYVKDAPSVEPERKRSGWIPVMKELPPEEEMVLVSCRTAKGVNTVNRAYYMNGSWHGSGSMSGVKAWQPMPDAYEGE